MGIIDLHVHTKYSDGEYMPLEILNICKEKNISTVAIADHNTIEGSKEAILNNPYKDITIIPAIEFSADYPIEGATCHILGYGIDFENKCLMNLAKRLREQNKQKVIVVCEALKKEFNFKFKEEDVEAILNSIGNIGKPDVARLCVQYGYCDTIRQAFDKYIVAVDSYIKYEKFFPKATECIEYIHNAGGLATLAHPIELKKDGEELKEYIKYLAENSLDAVEVYQSKHTPQYSEEILNIAEELQIAYSVGSDFHGPFISPGFEVGSGKDNNLNKTYASILNIL